MKKIFLIFIIVTITFISCKKRHYKACINASKNLAAIGEVITFSDCSDYDGGAKGNIWSFGDGASKNTNGDPSVMHLYSQAGQYTVMLTIGEKENQDECKVIITIQ